jgi:hypothetical protein
MPSKPKTDEEIHPENYFTNPVGHPRDRIIIHESMEIPKEGLFLSLNGFPFLARPGIEIDLPRPVRLMLDTRIKTETIQGEDGKDYRRNIPRITYTLVKENVHIPDASVIDAVDAKKQEATSDF